MLVHAVCEMQRSAVHAYRHASGMLRHFTRAQIYAQPQPQPWPCCRLPSACCATMAAQCQLGPSPTAASSPAHQTPEHSPHSRPPPPPPHTQSGYPSSVAAIKGTIKVAGQEIGHEKMRAISGFVHQEDVIMDTMTVREALTFSSMLRLPQSMDKKAKVRQHAGCCGLQSGNCDEPGSVAPQRAACAIVWCCSS